MWDIIVDSILDTLKLLPLLFLVYLLIEWIERKTAGGWRGNRLLRGRWAPLIGSTVGLLPQCGFSVIVTNLYAGGLVGLGARNTPGQVASVIAGGMILSLVAR